MAHHYPGPERNDEDSNDGVGQRQKVFDLQFSGWGDAKTAKKVDKICGLLTRESRQKNRVQEKATNRQIHINMFKVEQNCKEDPARQFITLMAS